MKPLHGSFKRLTRCPCCAGKYHKRNGNKHGKTAGRQFFKRQMRKEIY